MSYLWQDGELVTAAKLNQYGAGLEDIRDDAEDAADRAEEAVVHSPIVQDGTWWVWNQTSGAYQDTEIEAEGPAGTDGEDGVSPTISETKVGKVTTVTVTDAEGTHTFEIHDGQDGSGIGDMLKSVYDTEGREEDIFEYVDTGLSGKVGPTDYADGSKGGVFKASPNYALFLNANGYLMALSQSKGSYDSAVPGLFVSKGTLEALRTAGDIGAKNTSFQVTLTAAGWSSNAQTVSNANILTGSYDYFVAPSPSSFSNYAEAVIYADEVTTAGQMTFHCSETPTANIVVNIVRSEHV